MAIPQSRLKRAFYSSLTSGVYQIVAIICGFISSRLIIGAYGSSWNGVLTSITQFLSLFTILEAGINGSTRVALYKSFANHDLKKTSGIIKANDIFYRKISIFLVFYVGIIAVIIPNIVDSNHEKWMIAAMVGIIGLSSFAENCWGINSKILLTASQSRYIINIAETFSKIANLIVLWIIVRLGGSILAAKSGSSIVLTIVPIVLFVISRSMFRIDKNAKPDNAGLKGRWDVIANSISNIVHQNVDVIFLTIFCASSEVSVYSLYYLVAGGLTKVFTVVINGIEAGFGEMWAKGETENLKNRLRQFEYIMYSLALLLFGSMIVLVVPFMGIYMKDVTDVNYQRYLLGVLIGVSEILMSIRTPYVLLVQAAGHYKQVKKAGFIEAGINILLTCILVQKFGIVGAIVGTIVANTYRTTMYGLYASNSMLHRPAKAIVLRIIWLALSLLIAISLSTIAVKYILINSWTTWIVAAVITFIIHFAVYIFGSFLFYKKDLLDSLDLLPFAFLKKRKRSF